MLAVHRAIVDLEVVQLVRKAAFLVAIVLCLGLVVFGDSRWPGGSAVHETIEWAGIVLMVICVLGRTWSAIYIGGRKAAEFVTEGPYSVSRNPLYFFSIVGAVGAGAQLGSVVLALAAGLIAWIVLYLVVRKEEKYLATAFGNPYRQYLARVPRFIPRPSLWRDADSLQVRPSLVLRTFVDACVFFLSIPLAEGFEFLHEQGILPVLVQLP